MPDRTALRALILPGAANHGAYQAGVIVGLAEQLGLGEGEPLPYDLVTGASSGAINAYFVATAQYAKLAAFWHRLPRLAAVRWRPEYRATHGGFSPLRWVNRVVGFVPRVLGSAWVFLQLVTRSEGIFGSDTVSGLIGEFVDVRRPVFMPLFVSTTNLTRQDPQILRFRATGALSHVDAAIDSALAGARVPAISVVEPALIGDVLLASAALPIVFRPVRLALTPDGATEEFGDGGVVDNAPFDVARSVATALDTIITDPFSYYGPHHDRYRDAMNVGVAAYSAMQRRMLWYALELLRPRNLAVRAIAPGEALPGRYLDFTDQDATDRAFQLGKADARSGFQTRSIE